MSMRYRWHFNARISAFFALFFPLMIVLGFWQLDREQQKQALLEQQTEQRRQAPMDISRVDWSRGRELAFLPVSAQGRYWQDRSFLLDNRTRDGRVGYEVLTPLQTTAGTVLVNRGWLPLGESRQRLPEIPDAPEEVDITGHVHVPEGEALVLSDRDDPLGDRWPRRIQAVNMEALGDSLGTDLLPHTIRLDADAEGALVTQWATDTIQPATHRGYAVQWFSMATVLLFLFVYSSLSRKENT